MIIFLDFDGVLHPDAVYQSRNRPLTLRADGELMMYAHVLDHYLTPYPKAEIVLSTSWVRVLGYDKTLSKMPEFLRARVSGATWHKAMAINGRDTDPFSWMSRFQQIESHVKRNGVKDWLAIDDLHSASEDWPEEMADRLVLTDGMLGLSCFKAQKELLKKLADVSNAELKSNG